MRRRIGLIFVWALVTLSASAMAPKYVFVFIGDGMSVPQRMVAEEFSVKTGGGELAMNHLPYQVCTRTKSANSVITDSAAAATAIACGEKTNNGMLGVKPDGVTRLDSVAEIAKRRGMKVGIATTVTIVHATPAGFYAHNRARGSFYQVALDLVASDFDFFCGGGVYDKADDRRDEKYRGNVFELAKAAGYRVVRNDLKAWRALTAGGKTWAVFGDYGMDFAIDGNREQPTPAEIVAKAIELLDGEHGFFLMLEGGKVDYAGHANDAATNLRDIIQLDAAVKVALAFQARHPETLIITTGDHETGGMSMGFNGSGGKFKVELLATQKISTESFSTEMKKLIRDRKGELAFDEVRPVIAEKFGLDRLTETEEKTLSAALAKDVENVRNQLQDTTAHDVKRRYVFAQAVKNALNARAGIGWSSGAHTALPTLTTAQGAGAEILLGMAENADIGKRLKTLLTK